VTVIDFTAFIGRLATASGETILPFFRTSLSIDNKSASDFDPVTEADRAAEAAMRGLIRTTFPDHGIIGEEFGAERTESSHVWVIDPIDGTRAFISGLPLWGTLVGLTDHGDAVAGMMSQPFTGELFWADGEASHYDGPGGARRLAVRATRGFRFQVRGETVVARPGSSVMRFRLPSDDDCVEWTSDLEVIAAANRMNVGYRTRESLLFAPGTWFWRPPVLTANRDIEFEVALPEGMQISVPWQPVPGERLRFRHGHMPLDWPGLMAVGKLKVDSFETPGGHFRLAITDGPARVDPVIVRRWLRAGALAVATLQGGFPVSESVQLLVIPLHEGYDAAPWAQTNRGGGPAVHLFMNAGADWAIFRDDWIATHELAHLALPYVRRSDAWLPEGFASYYQHVLRARLGIISNESAWQALHEGFMRGNRNTADGTLYDDSRQMQAQGRMMRVYWSGAAIALQADVTLRLQTDNAWSLDRVLREFNACCRKPERTWNARDLVAKFDEISGTEIFDSLYRAHVHTRHFPRLDDTWTVLGIEIENGEVRLRDGEGVKLRRAIMSEQVKGQR
jgi:hypothetical protein